MLPVGEAKNFHTDTNLLLPLAVRTKSILEAVPTSPLKNTSMSIRYATLALLEVRRRRMVFLIPPKLRP